jgi:DegV family protein with EDD domain
LPALSLSDSPFLFRYCTEALVQGAAIDRELIRREAALLGDSIVVAGSASKTRVHVHTNEPERLFEALRKHVEVLQTKVEDMEAQHRTLVDPDRATRVGIVTDSTCDLPPSMLEEYGIGVVPGRVIFGSENYLDKVTITPAEFYARFAETSFVPTTSQPPPADYTQVYTNVAVHAGSIVSIHVSAALSGIYQASLIGARPVPNTAFMHVDSRTVSVGLGLVVREAAEAAAAGKPVQDVARVAEEAARRVRLFIAVPGLQHLVRSGRVSTARGAIAGLFGVLPVLTMTEEGTVVRVGLSRSFEGARRKMMDLLFREVAGLGGASPRFGVAHCAAPGLADELANQLHERFRGADIMIAECGPAIGAHVGPGAVGVAVLTGPRSGGAPPSD